MVAVSSIVIGEPKEIKARNYGHVCSHINKGKFCVHEIFFSTGTNLFIDMCPPQATTIFQNYSASLDVQAVLEEWIDKTVMLHVPPGREN